MTSEVEERPRLVMAGYGRHGSQWVKGVDELAFWDENVDSLNFHSPWAPLQPPAKFVYSDASNHACSSFIDNKHKIFHQNWSPAESSNSSTWKELQTVDLALFVFALELQGKNLLGLLTTLVW